MDALLPEDLHDAKNYEFMKAQRDTRFGPATSESNMNWARAASAPKKNHKQISWAIFVF